MLGTRIAALRREAGLSQAELAQRLQVSPSALGMYEQERREPSMQTLVRLSRELGVTTDYLLTGTPAEKEREELEKMLLGRIRAADQRLEQRRERPFSREELAVLFAAMLMPTPVPQNSNAQAHSPRTTASQGGTAISG